MRWLYAVLGALVATGCAKAGKDAIGVGGRPDGGHPPLVDGDFEPLPDAPPIPDAPAGKMTVTLAQTNDMTVAAGQGVACGDGLGTGDNNWYRVFRLSDYGVTQPFTVQQVAFMIDYADAAAGQQPVQVKIGTYTGTVDAATLNTAQITPVGAQQVQVPNGDASASVPPPVAATFSNTIQPNQNLVVEVDAPDGEAAGNYFYLAVSGGGESHPGYIQSSACSVTQPSSLASQGFPNAAILLTVTGTY